MKKSLIIGFFAFLISGVFYAQVDEQLAAIQRTLSENSPDEAKQLFDKSTASYMEHKDYLNLAYFIPYAGYIAEKVASSQEGIKAAEDFLNLILKSSEDPRVRRQAYLEIHTYYLSAGNNQSAYEANQEALKYTFQMPNYRPEEWAIIERNLGVIANFLGFPDKAKRHTFKALEGFEQDPETSKESKFNVLNDIGVRYWYEAKLDSAEYYWLEGIRFLDEMEPTLTNSHFRKAMIEGNLAAVYDVKGNPQESIKRVKNSIDLFQYFIENAKEDPKWNRAQISFFYSIANLAAVYKSLGNYQKALQLHEYTLLEKEKHFDALHPEILETKIHIGQSHNSLKNFLQAEQYLVEALDGIAQKEGEFYLQAGDAHYTLGMVYESTQEFEKAKKHYLKANENFLKGLKDKADHVYINFLDNVSHFFSLQGDSNTALELAQKGFDYITMIDGRNTITGFAQLLNLGEVYFNLKHYCKAKTYADKSLQLMETLIQNAKGGLDSVRVEFDKPQAILLQVKSDYHLNPNPSVSYLESSLEKLMSAQLILERRKNTLNNSEDIGVLQSQSQELLSFIKKIQLELYERTRKNDYLNSLLVVLESEVYSKIRAQINQAGRVAFKGVPKTILDKEALLKASLKDEFEEANSLSEFLNISTEWENFLIMLKKEYPEYYKARYANISIQEISIPKSLQAVRYFFVKEQLYAMVLCKGVKRLYHLEFDATLINKLSENWHEAKTICTLSHELYKQLWQPFAQDLTDERVLVIPDGVLFNLGFDMLSTDQPKGYREFASKSLLAKHDIYYNFSLSLNVQKPKSNITSNYIVFAPGFIDNMKEEYFTIVKDSTLADKTYLSLLPQPFTLSLAKNARKSLGGEGYLLEESIPEVFRQKAGNHKIIHIGTHAESNNLSPAFSRLIFSKTNREGLVNEENSVYAYEIYNTDLYAELAILTACETGKPIYQPGEGMVSLSHAFIYSGSKSLLTSLWKIDEKASNQITEIFLNNLKKGLPKDRALRLAKLQYLGSAHGRTLSPQYWAGLILIGNPDPIKGLNNPTRWILWGIGIVLISLVFFYLSRKLTSKVLLSKPKGYANQ